MFTKSIYPHDLNLFSDYKPPSERIDQIEEDGSNVSIIVRENLINFLRLKFFTEKLGKKYSYDSFKRILLYHVFDSDNETFNKIKTFINEFFISETKCFFLVEDLGPKNYLYAQFFADNSLIPYQINNLILLYRAEITINKKPYADYAKALYNTDIVDLGQIESNLNTLIADIIKFSAIDLMLDFKFSEHKKTDIDFDFNRYLFHTLITEKSQLQLYQQSVLNWLMYVSQNLKMYLHLTHELPLFTQVIQWIKEEINNAGLDLFNQDYPKFIFRDYKSYKLFHSIVVHFKYIPQVSYLYRQMNEKENPRLIVAGIKDFILWFNEENYDIQLNESLKTFEQSHTFDREAFYTYAKNLIIKD